MLPFEYIEQQGLAGVMGAIQRGHEECSPEQNGLIDYKDEAGGQGYTKAQQNGHKKKE